MRKVLITLLVLLAACTGCTEKEVAKHVIIIGLDGWGSYSMEEAKVPFIRQCMKEGSYTLYKRTIRPSVSGPNWAAQMNVLRWSPQVSPITILHHHLSLFFSQNIMPNRHSSI